MNEAKPKRRARPKRKKDIGNLQEQCAELNAQKQQQKAAQFSNQSNGTQGTTPEVVKPVGNIGNLCEFTLTDDWVLWTEKFEYYVLVNEVPKEKKLAVFITFLNMEAYAVLRNLCAPSLPDTKSLEDLQKLMTVHLNSTPNVITARYRFKECRQKEGEKIKEYISNLQALSAHCNYGANLDSALRDQFVWGVKSDVLKKILLGEINLTFERATEIAAALESSDSDESHSFGQREGFKELWLTAEALIYWRNPLQSCMVFFLILSLLLSVAIYSLISTLAFLLITILFLGITIRICQTALPVHMAPEHPLKDFRDLTLPAEKVHEFADLALAHANAAIPELRRLFLAEDLVESLKLGILLCSLTCIGSWFSVITVLIIGVVALFTLPKVYERNKTQIDQYFT